MAAYDFPDTAGKPTDGSFEYTAPDGTLYEWNGYAWVVPTDESGGGSGGAARVLTQVLPPSPAEDGDMYWCTDDGRLYLYYDDADTKQWVDASPDGGGNNVEKLIAGDNITLSPADGKGVVTINSTGGGGGGPTTPGVRYQSGTWTPTSNGTFTSSAGVWSRSGNTVTAWFSVRFGSETSGDAMFISGLPYLRVVPSDGTLNAVVRTGGSLSYSNKTEARTVMFNTSESTQISIRVVASSATETLSGASEGDYRGSITYLTEDTTFTPVNSAVVTEDIQGTGGSGGGGTTEIYGTAKASGSVAADGTLSGAFNCTATKTGVGQYQITFVNPEVDSNYTVVSNPIDNRGVATSVANKTLTGFILYTYGIGAAAREDYPVNFTVHDNVPITVSGGGGGGGTTVNYNGASAWGNVDADGTLKNGLNSTVSKITTGEYEVTLDPPAPNENYAVVLGGASPLISHRANNKTVNGFRVLTKDPSGTATDITFSYVVHSANAIAPQSGVGADAWARFNTVGTLKGSFNCSVVASSNTYTVTFNVPMPSENYAVVANTYKDQGEVKIDNQTASSFRIVTYDSEGVPLAQGAHFTVHASSTVTPTYTWTRNGTRLEPANAGDDVGSSGGLSDTDTSWRISGEGQIDSWGSAGYGLTIADTSSGSAQETIVLNRDGSATFAKNKTQFFSNGGFATYPSTSDTATRVRVIYSGPTEQAAVSIEGNGQASSNAILVKQIGGTDKVIVRHDGSAVFKGGVTPSNVFFNLEADDDTKYTATTDADGNETLVYNGATLDVKALLLTLQTAAARIATLEAKVQTLESDHTTLMNNNNNGGGY